jgi:hypothetical protein
MKRERKSLCDAASNKCRSSRRIIRKIEALADCSTTLAQQHSRSIMLGLGTILQGRDVLRHVQADFR